MISCFFVTLWMTGSSPIEFYCDSANNEFARECFSIRSESRYQKVYYGAAIALTNKIKSKECKKIQGDI